MTPLPPLPTTNRQVPPLLAQSPAESDGRFAALIGEALEEASFPGAVEASGSVPALPSAPLAELVLTVLPIATADTILMAAGAEVLAEGDAESTATSGGDGAVGEPHDRTVPDSLRPANMSTEVPPEHPAVALIPPDAIPVTPAAAAGALEVSETGASSQAQGMAPAPEERPPPAAVAQATVPSLVGSDARAGAHAAAATPGRSEDTQVQEAPSRASSSLDSAALPQPVAAEPRASNAAAPVTSREPSPVIVDTAAVAPDLTAGPAPKLSDAGSREAALQRAAEALRAAPARPQRATAPSLSGPISAASVVTLNGAAAAPPAAPPPAADAPHSPAAPNAPAAPDAARPAQGPAPNAATAEQASVEQAPEQPSDMPSEQQRHQPGGPPLKDVGRTREATPAPPMQQILAGWTAFTLGSAQGLSAPVPALQAAAAAPRAPATPAQQLMPVLVTLAADPAGSARGVTVTLEPVELGRVEIAVRSEQEKLTRIRVTAERPETLLLLLRDQAALDRALAQAGVGPEGREISFDLAGGERGTEGRASGDRREPAQRTAARTPEPDARPDAAAQRRAPGGLDIAV